MRKFGRGNYQTYSQNLQAQLLGAKPTMREPRNPSKPEYKDDEDIGFFTHKGELPYRDYGKHLDKEYQQRRAEIDARYKKR